MSLWRVPLNSFISTLNLFTNIPEIVSKIFWVNKLKEQNEGYPWTNWGIPSNKISDTFEQIRNTSYCIFSKSKDEIKNFKNLVSLRNMSEIDIRSKKVKNLQRPFIANFFSKICNLKFRKEQSRIQSSVAWRTPCQPQEQSLSMTLRMPWSFLLVFQTIGRNRHLLDIEDSH